MSGRERQLRDMQRDGDECAKGDAFLEGARRTNSDAYRAGKSAAHAGYPASNNPYPDDDERRWQWMDGFISANARRRRRR